MSKSSIDYSELAGLNIAISHLSAQSTLSEQDKIAYRWIESRVQALKNKQLDNLSDWYLDNYGLCSADRCYCLVNEWQGRSCPDWQSFNATNYEELALAQKLFQACSSMVRAERS